MKVGQALLVVLLLQQRGASQLIDYSDETGVYVEYEDVEYISEHVRLENSSEDVDPDMGSPVDLGNSMKVSSGYKWSERGTNGLIFPGAEKQVIWTFKSFE